MRKLLFLIFILAAVVVRPVAAQAGPVFMSLHPGQVLQGVVAIQGSSDVPGFLSAEVAFAYAGDTTGTWFLIVASNQPVASNTLATWDTTTITDGDYNLRLRVYLTDGSHLDTIVQNLRVRNYTPVETPTPAPTPLQATPLPTITLTATQFPTPTSLPPNPAVLTPADVSISLAYGGLGAMLFLAILGIYGWLRRK
ncbi:MAG: hypothetical protein WCE68_01300 [Anaerolineales bacterium]